MIHERDNFIMMSYEQPRHKSSVKVDSITDFAKELGKRIELKKIQIAQTKGKYSGVEENSVMLKLPANARMIDLLAERYAAIKLGKELGQESILLRVNDENFLIDCQNETIIAKGKGFKATDADDNFTELNGSKFTLNLDF